MNIRSAGIAAFVLLCLAICLVPAVAESPPGEVTLATSYSQAPSDITVTFGGAQELAPADLVAPQASNANGVEQAYASDSTMNRAVLYESQSRPKPRHYQRT